MRGLSQAFTALLCCVLLSACNTSEALTPKEDVPNVDSSQSTNQPGQTQQMAARQDTDQRRPLKKLDEDVPEATERRAPQNTMEAQQQAIDTGQQDQPTTETRTVADNSSDTTTLSANLYKNNSDAKPSTSIYSSAATKGTIRFLPIIGAPVQAVTPLSKELGASARSNGLTIKASSDQTAEHVLKGYLSAFQDGKSVTVVYVWDVLDNAGARLHRIQGQESVPSKQSDAWSSVPPELMQEIGNATIADYMKWRQSQG